MLSGFYLLRLAAAGHAAMQSSSAGPEGCWVLFFCPGGGAKPKDAPLTGLRNSTLPNKLLSFGYTQSGFSNDTN